MSKKTTDETLGREAVKEYLQQYHTAVGKKRILEERPPRPFQRTAGAQYGVRVQVDAADQADKDGRIRVRCLSGSPKWRTGSRSSGRKWPRPS